MKDGRMITWFRHSTADGQYSIHLTFRYQDFNNCYFMHFRPSTTLCTFYKRKAGGHNVLGTGNWVYALDTWYKVRISWWNMDNGSLGLRAEKWVGDEWVPICDDFEDPENDWADVGGRVGFRWMIKYKRFDDTEIWSV